MELSFVRSELPVSGALVLGVFKGGTLTPLGEQVDQASGGLVRRALAANDRFTGKAGQTLSLPVPAGLSLSAVILLGLGKAEGMSASTLETFGGQAQAALVASGATEGAVGAEPALAPALEGAEVAARVALGARLRAYRFDRYRTREKAEDKPRLARVAVLSADPAAAEAAFAPLDGVAQGVLFARDLQSEPANVIYPESFAQACQDLAALGVGVEVLGEPEMRALGMGALLGVAQGSAREPKLVILSWNGGPAEQAPSAIVGKGVCFDSGGISIKPAGGMEDMKWDMAGAAVVAGLMKALALRKAPVNVVGLCGLVENMPSGTAQRPGDVVTSMSGQTIEVINTDAEGRLVLADVLHYANDRFKPARMIDLATLTGAIIIALGNEYAGLFSNDDALADSLTAAGKTVGEALWRMPLGEAYDKQIDSDIADIKNTGGREGGAITAAQFLQRFVDKTPWAHLDIAAVTWAKKDGAVTPKGCTGYGVRLLDAYLRTLEGAA
ncbi:leucyl aminopeptidase [Pararhodospirillum oryzae]|uniref:Probable cytosol aminopeptidase n=1 Tax=Pararhodospirillum oryzae TaxID=478448 RepID=A0A512H440_9PROT|nr:leucyl aminopeptidase [Pararhodospirillum oryzae]GEO80225.1 putative cytosol aminopeptidase [Pararhodospirillum oryzae]